MRPQNFLIEQLSEGFFELFRNGDFKKMNPARLQNPEQDSSLGQTSSALGIDPLLISNGDKNVIVDPGLGWGLDQSSGYHNTSNIITNLDIFGLRPQDIDFVILSHLHFDHVAGSTFVSETFKTTATFPNARYIVRKEEWEFALTQQFQSPDKTPGADYSLDELYKLKAEGRFHFIEDDLYEPVKGVTVMKSGGHTPGHQVVKVENGSEISYFLGDLIPTEFHLNHYAMRQIDHNSLHAKKSKTLLLRKAFNENAKLYFYHSLYNKSGRLAKDKHKNYVLIDANQ